MKLATFYCSLLVGLLEVILIVLKLSNAIDWTWWLVTLPVWGGVIILFFAIAVEAVAMFLWARSQVEFRDPWRKRH